MIDINKASLNELMSVKGIGKTTAKNILKYREENNSFNDLSELRNVRGIAKKTYKSLKDSFLEIENDSNQNLFKIEVNVNDFPIENPDEVHLVGDMNDWNPEDKTYSLKENENGIWSNNFDLNPGTEYKIMVDSTNWDDNRHFGYYGGNLTVE